MQKAIGTRCPNRRNRRTISRNPNDTDMSDSNEFEKAAEEKQSSLVAEFFLFMRRNKKLWLLPLILVLLLLAGLIWLAGTGAAPFIYTLF